MVAITRAKLTAEQLAVKAGDRVIWSHVDGTEEVRTVAIGPTPGRVFYVGPSRVVWLVGRPGPVLLQQIRPAWRILFQDCDHVIAGGSDLSPSAHLLLRRCCRAVWHFALDLVGCFMLAFFHSRND
jgi:hypothetical protein